VSTQNPKPANVGIADARPDATAVIRAVVEATRALGDESTEVGRVWPCLVGETGTGKTSRAEALRKALGFEHLEVVLLHSEEGTDVLGLPRVRGGVTVFAPRERWIAAASRPTLIFLDEMDKARKDVVGSVLTLLSSLWVYGVRLHPQTAIVAAMQPVDVDLWRESKTHAAFSARLCFVPVDETEAWTWISKREGVDLADIYGVGEMPPLPVNKRVSPRQAHWFTRFLAQYDDDTHAGLRYAVGEGLGATREQVDEHLARVRRLADPRLRLRLLSQDKRRLLEWVAEVATFTDLTTPAAIEALFSAPDEEAFLVALRRLVADGGQDNLESFLSRLGPTLEVLSHEQGRDGSEVEVFGSRDEVQVADSFMQACRELWRLQEERRRKTAAGV
jgi:hypothetical protein